MLSLFSDDGHVFALIKHEREKKEINLALLLTETSSIKVKSS